MASGHRKRRAAALRIEVLNPAGLTNLPASEAGNTTNLNNLINISYYSRDGVAPTFTAAATELLSNAISNADGAWTKAGLTGETTNAGTFVVTSISGSVGVSATSKHYYFPAVGGTQTVLSGATSISSSVIIYSPEGPQASYVPYYLGGTAATASIKFGTAITGAGSPTHVIVYVAGELASNDVVRAVSPAGTVLQGKLSSGSATAWTGVSTLSCTASSADLAANLYRKVFAIPTGNIGTAGGLVVEFSSSAKTSTTPVAGVFVVISSGSY
jgi:hypothetical protein